MIGRSTIAMLMAASVAVPATALLTGCEKAQTAGGSVKKSDAKPWDGPAPGATYAAEGFKGGDKVAWEAQLKARTERGQNEYTRTAPAKK